MFTPMAEIIHYGGASEPSQADRWMKVFQAKSTLIQRHWPQRYIKFGLRILFIWVASRAAVMTVLAALAPKKYSLQKEKWAHVYRSRNRWLMGFVDSDNNLFAKYPLDHTQKLQAKL
jgi:hypothetical protein